MRRRENDFSFRCFIVLKCPGFLGLRSKADAAGVLGKTHCTLIVLSNQYVYPLFLPALTSLIEFLNKFRARRRKRKC